MDQLTLISATPSPIARMNRIALALKGIPFTLKNKIPWESTTETPKFNPLEKRPILVFPDDRPTDRSSTTARIIRNISSPSTPTRGHRLITGDVDKDLEIRQIVVLVEGCLDAVVISRFEARHEPGQQSNLWMDRQSRKIDGALRAFNDLISARVDAGKDYLVGDELSIADIAAVCTVG